MEYIRKDSSDRQERHLVVYIESHDKRPHSVITVTWNEDNQEWNTTCNNWDFEVSGSESDLIFSQLGWGGSVKDIQAPHYVDGTTGCTVWLHPMANFQDGSTPINCEIVAEPPIYESWRGSFANPFKHGEEHISIDYCEECDIYYGDYGCDVHGFPDEEE